MNSVPPLSHLRAALLFLALLGNAVYALPLPAAVSRSEVRKEGHQHDITMWEGWLRAAGFEVTHRALEDLVVDGSALLGGAHKTLKKPWAPLFGLVGANQAWALFASATTKPDRLVVEIERARGTGWVAIERRLDPCCTWRDDQLRYRRIRGVWDGQKESMRAGYKGLTKWMAREVFLDHPDALRMRVYLEQTVSTYPWEPPNPAVVVRHERVHGRATILGTAP